MNDNSVLSIGSLKALSRVVEYPLPYLEDLAQRVDSCYKPGRIPKKRLDHNGKRQYRNIMKINSELKEVQKRILQRVLYKVQMPQCAMGGIRGKDNIQNASLHKGKRSMFQTDIRNFFPSISHVAVYRSLIGLGLSADVSRLLTRLTTVGGSLPQGGVTSSIIANIVLIQLDARLEEWAHGQGISYTRYVDDLTFSAPYDFRHLTSEIVQVICQAGFAINRQKTRFLSKNSKEVTGVLVRHNSIQPLEHHIQLESDQSLNEQSRKGYQNYNDRIRMLN